jgi:hypothetical protein
MRGLEINRKMSLLNLSRRSFIRDSSLALYLPLWHPDLSVSPFLSKDLNAHSCTVTGATWGNQGRTFDGIDDVINCGSAAILDTAFGGDTTGAYTYEWWAKNTIDGPSRGQLVKGVDPTFWGMWTADAAGSLNLYWEIKVTGETNDLFVYWTIGDVSTSFNHFMLTGSGRAAAGWTLYKNNSLVSMNINSNTLSSNVGNTADDLFAPGRAWGASGYFKGIEGEVWVYNRAKTLAESNYLATKWRYSA